MRCVLMAVALSCLFPGCAEHLDLDLPIALIPDTSFSEEQVESIREAAESWNLEVGTRLQVERSSAAAQQVRVLQSEMACAFTNGVTYMIDELEVWICALDASSSKRFWQVTLHELGHVLNIRDHADDPLAVMSPSNNADKNFQPEDHRMFREANADFEGQEGCSVAWQLGESPSRPVMVQTAGGRTFALWAEKDRLRYSELDVKTAGPGGLNGSVPTQGAAQWVRSVPTTDGFSIHWAQKGRSYHARVKLPSGKVSAPVLLETRAFDFEDRVKEVSFAVIGAELFLAVSEGYRKSNLWMFRVDATTGKSRPFARSNPTDGQGQLVTLGADLFLVVRDYSVLWVEHLGHGGTLIRQLKLASQIPDPGWDSVQARAVTSGIVVASRLSGDPLALFRVGYTSAGLVLEQSTSLKLPANSRQTHISMAGTSCGLALGLNNTATKANDIFVSVVNPSTFKVNRPWKRISSPDFTHSVQPWLAASGCQFMALWRDIQDVIKVRSRCF